MTEKRRFRWPALALVIALNGYAQDDQVRTRELWDTNLLNKRPAGRKAEPAKAPAGVPKDDGFVGITLWRLRPSKPADEQRVRSLIQEESGQREWTPERLTGDTPLLPGQKVRISVESARTGYLYVIDREEYAGGAKGDPYLIFPTLRTRGGNNRVAAGVLIEIPAADDSTPYFTVENTRADQTGELLTILVSKEPLAGVSIGDRRLKLTEAQVEQWEKKWKAKTQRLDAKGQAGKAYTGAEKDAGAGKSQLTHDDPVPQTMYRVDAKPGAPLLVEFRLNTKK